MDGNGRSTRPRLGTQTHLDTLHLHRAPDLVPPAAASFSLSVPSLSRKWALRAPRRRPLGLELRSTQTRSEPSVQGPRLSELLLPAIPCFSFFLAPAARHPHRAHGQVGKHTAPRACWSGCAAGFHASSVRVGGLFSAVKVAGCCSVYDKAREREVESLSSGSRGWRNKRERRQPIGQAYQARYLEMGLCSDRMNRVCF